VEAKKLIDEMADSNLLLLGFSGGEPLLRQDIYELIRYATQKGIAPAISTNGIIIDEDKAKRLKEAGASRVQVSIDGSSPSTHNSIRQVPGMFEKAIEAFHILKDADLQVTIGTTPMRPNLKEIPDIIELAIELGAKVLNLSQFVPTGRGNKDLDLTPWEWKELLVFWQKKRKELKATINLATHEPRLALIDEDVASMHGFIGCQAGCTHCCITADGFVEPCVMMDLKVGNVRQQPFKQIWQESSILNKMRNRQLLKGKCGICEHKNKCGGCRAVAYAYTGDFLEEDLRCWHQPQGKM
jgi:radical SAM protein with 4Fe4S-binding SPASM domain